MKRSNMLITNILIQSLNPCEDRFNNYLKYYKDKNHTPRQFMGLKNITHDDKIWVAFRLMPKDNLRLAAADIVESVLHLWEKEFPNDDSPRKAIEAARRGNKEECRLAAWEAYNSYSFAIYTRYDSANVANAASYAANTVACAPCDTIYAASYAIINAINATYAGYAAYTADYAYCAVNNISSDCRAKQKEIRTIILKYWR